MGLILIGMLFAIYGCMLIKHVVKSETEKLYVVKCIVAAMCCFIAVMSITSGFCGIRMEEGFPELKDTQYVALQNKDELKYEVFDEGKNILYHFGKDEVEVLKDGKRGMYGNKIMYDCTVIEGDYDQPYIEEYSVDYKMNFWSFELTNTTEYILYVPKN